ncbi:MAG TPA: hypothetical protein VGQ93_11770 [Lysobacter sp.]|nr:hypothetical protein [Lysobacter sp.]
MNHTTMQYRMGIAGATLCGLALAAAAWANDPTDKFKSMDSNGDGLISADEHAAGARAMFDRMDTNHDGNVTTAEMDAGHKMKMKDDKGMHHDMSSADKIAKMDTNGDGMLSASEHDASAQAMFDEMDTDKNGSISQEEMRAGHAMKEKGHDM